MIEEHSNVVLARDLPEHDLFKGDVGVVVHVLRCTEPGGQVILYSC